MSFRLILPLALSIVGSAACTTKHTKYAFEMSSPANAGTADVQMTASESGNGDLALQFEHLAPPKKIDAALTAYVVWTQADGAAVPTKLGVLPYDAKKRSGKLKATYSGTHMKIIVTLEADPATQVPTGPRVLDVDLAAPRR